MMRRFFLSVACLGLLSCASVDGPLPVPSSPTPRAWQVDRVESQGALASVWGSGPSDVWAAGGQKDRGLVLHFDGKGWSPVETGAKSFLWWIYGSGADDVYAVGDKGLILHYDGEAWTTVPSGTDRTLYGLWAAGPDDVWAVGGDPWGQPGDAVLLRGNAAGFHQVSVPSALLPEGLYKIYGTPAGDVVAVGTSGTILRYDGQWRRDAVPTSVPLVSLWGAGGERLYAVGGQGTGVVLHYDGARWSQVDGVEAGLALYGVFKAPNQPVFAVGAGPRIVQLGAGSEAIDLADLGIGSSMVLHSVWGDGHGTVYAAGGTLYGDPTKMTGLLLRR